MPTPWYLRFFFSPWEVFFSAGNLSYFYPFPLSPIQNGRTNLTFIVVITVWFPPWHRRCTSPISTSAWNQILHIRLLSIK
jgi:hypothetical protein